MTLGTYIAVFIGGGLGASLRFYSTQVLGNLKLENFALIADSRSPTTDGSPSITTELSLFWQNLPIATLLVNSLGAILLGVVFELYFQNKNSDLSMHYLELLAKISADSDFFKLITIGLLGGLTTFSTLSVEVALYFRHDLFMSGVLYIAISAIIAMFAAMLGMFAVKALY